MVCAVLPYVRTKPVTDQTAYRLVGDCTPTRFAEVLKTAGSPIAGTDVTACYDAARGHTLLALAQAAKETQYGKAVNGANNAFNVMNSGRFVAYSRWSDSFAAFAERCRDVSFKSGVYGAEYSIRQFLTVFIGGPGCLAGTCANGETTASVDLAVRQAVDRINRIVAAPAPTPAALVIGAVPRPQNFSDRIISPALNTAWTDLGTRQPRGIVLHRMLGSLDGTDAFFRSTRPYPYGAAANARTDFGVGVGRVYQWTPLHSNIAPWASGPATDIEGDGVPFVNRYGVNAINRDTASVELAGNYGDAITPDDWQRLVELVAWLADTWMRLRHDQFPRNHDGLWCVLWHSEFGPKECPGSVVMNRTEELISAVQARMKRFQVGA